MTPEKENGSRKKWLLILATLAVISIVFTWISWKSMHPSDLVTVEQVEKYADQKLIDDMECINGSYVVLIYNEDTKESSWYAIDEENGMEERLAQIAEKTDIQIKTDNISLPGIFIMYVIQFGICYGFVWLVWKLYGKFRIGRRKEHYKM